MSGRRGLIFLTHTRLRWYRRTFLR